MILRCNYVIRNYLTYLVFSICFIFISTSIDLSFKNIKLYLNNNVYFEIWFEVNSNATILLMWIVSILLESNESNQSGFAKKFFDIYGSVVKSIFCNLVMYEWLK